MTQIKKFAWSGAAVALAMVVAMSMIVSTAHAAAPGLALGSATIVVGEETTLTITNNRAADAPDTFTVSINPASRAAFVVGGQTVGQTSVTIDGPVGTTGTVTVRGLASSATPATITVQSNNVPADNATINVTVNAAPAVASVTNAALPALTAFGTGTTATTPVTATVRDAANAVIPGASVAFTASGNAVLFVTASGGSTCSGAATSFTNTTCNATAARSGRSAGVATVGVQATAASGSYTITATSGGATDSSTGNIAATAGAVEITQVTRTTLQNTTVGDNNTSRGTITVHVTAAGGGVLSGQNVVISAAGTAAAGITGFSTVAEACGGGVASPRTLTTGTDGNLTFLVCAGAAHTPGQTLNVTATVTAGGQTASAMQPIVIAGAVENVELTGPDTVAIGGTGQYTIKVTDEGGRAVGGVAPTVATTGGTQGNSVTLIGTRTNADGEINVAFSHGGSTIGSAVITATAGNGFASKTIGIGQAPAVPPQPGAGGFAAAPNFGTGNVGSAVFNGGSIEQLAEAAADADGTAVWVQGTNGNWYRYSIGATGATAFVNNAFNTQFAAGFAGATPVFVVK